MTEADKSPCMLSHPRVSGCTCLAAGVAARPWACIVSVKALTKSPQTCGNRCVKKSTVRASSTSPTDPRIHCSFRLNIWCSFDMQWLLYIPRMALTARVDTIDGQDILHMGLRFTCTDLRKLPGTVFAIAAVKPAKYALQHRVGRSIVKLGT